MADRFTHLEDYLSSWGQPGKLLPALADDYVLDDPAEPDLITKETLIDWMARWEDSMKAAGGTGGVENSDSVVQDKDGLLIHWNWWHFTGTDVMGSTVIKVSDKGVTHQRVAYHGLRPVPHKEA